MPGEPCNNCGNNPAYCICEHDITEGINQDTVAAVWTELVHWPTFWTEDHSEEEWIAWPLIPKGRQTALYAPAKSGKSFITLAVVAAATTGRPILGRPNTVGPVNILYLDYEMTRDDLHERLDELGYGPDDDLTHLHYALLPSLPPLNTEEGATAVLGLASAVEAVAVVIDTTGRAVWGEENVNDTYKDFAATTGYTLKQAGIAVLRTDHAGKDNTKGQRGASAKNDDVDVVIRIEPVDDGLILHRTHSRIGWAPVKVNIERTDRDHITTYTVNSDANPYPEGTKELVATMRSLGITHDTSRRVAAEMLRNAGQGVRSRRIGHALRWMREELPTFGTRREPPREPPPDGTPGNHPGTTTPKPASTSMGTTREPLGTTLPGQVGTSRYPEGVPLVPALPDDEDYPF